jgi:hypothetical protein
MRLNAKKYETLNEIIREAEAAEWMKQSMDQGYLHNIEQVNLLTPRFVKKKTFDKPQDSNQASGFSKPGNTNSRKCYSCGEENHFASDCPNKKQVAHRSFQRYSARQQSFQTNRRRFPNKVETMIKPYSRRGISSNRRNPQTRQWMIKNRSRWNVRRRQLNRLYHIDIEEDFDFNKLDDDEQFLFTLEDQLDDDEYDSYFQEVENETDELETIVEKELENFEPSEDDSKNLFL